MTQDQLSPPTASIPVVRDTELRLAKMRRQLEDVFRGLDLVHDEVSVSSDAARSKGLPELADVLSLCVCNRLFSELKSLTDIIERLGGRTDLSDEKELAPETAQNSEAK